MKQTLIVFAIFLTMVASIIAQPKKVVNPTNVVSEANFYVDGTELLSDAMVVKFKEKVVTSDDVAKNFAQRIDSKFQNILNVLKEIEKKAGKIRLDKSIKNADPNNLTRINKRTGKPVTIKDLSQVYHLRFDNPVSVTDAINAFKDIPEIEYVHQAVTTVLNFTPNDPLFTSPGQWNLDAVQAEDAWNITTGYAGISIGVVDQGIYFNHEDLYGKKFRSDDVITGAHGTWVAGVAGAKTNNDTGIASLGFNIKLNSYNVSNNSIADAIDNATVYSDIISMSFGTAYQMTYNDLVEIGCPAGFVANKWAAWITLKPYNYSEVADAVANAITQGVVCIASAGNESVNLHNYLYGYPELCDTWMLPKTVWPAAYSGVIAVSGTGLNQSVEEFVDIWNYGSFVDVSAPGWEIITTDYPSGYIELSGTSFSAPLTAALAGLVLSLNSSLTVQQVSDYLMKSADKIGQYNYDGNGWNQYMGYGRINAYKTVQPPSAPQNLSYSNVSGHPQLSWSAGEWDVKIYEIWRDVGSGYSKIAEVNAPTTTYDDYDLIISGSNPYSAWYYVKAKDLTNLTSTASSSLRVRYYGMQKEGLQLEIVQLPTNPTLYQNYPNPFNPVTTIKYSVPEEQFVSIKLFNGIGQEIATIVDGIKQPGFYQLSFDASKLSSGIYFYTMTSGNKVQTQKMILQK
jgi:thermitase